MQPTPRLALTVPVALALAAPSLAGAVTVEYDTPTLDRWNYPFNPSPGTRASAAVFGAVGEADFEDRDGQFLIGFDTGADIEPGLPPSNYTITSARLTLTVAGGGFQYDPTYDDYRTYLDPEDPDFIPGGDADGRPVELYGAEFRNGFTAATFQENSPFGPPFVIGGRNALATDAVSGNRDVTNNIRERFNPAPFAIGQIAGLSVGAIAPGDAVMTFDIDLDNADARRFLQEGLAMGRVRLMATSLKFPNAGKPTLETGEDRGAPNYPIFFTKEDKFAEFFDLAPQFSITVEIGAPLPGDANGDGIVNFSDLNIILNQFGQTGPGLQGDLNGDEVVNFSDLNTVLNNFGASA